MPTFGMASAQGGPVAVAGATTPVVRDDAAAVNVSLVASSHSSPPNGVVAAVSQTQQTQQSQTQLQQPSPVSPFTRVDGKGLWRSWKRNFKNKLLALLDLIDNSLDASIVVDGDGRADDDEDFVGRVHIYPDVLKNGGGSGGGGTTSKYFDDAAADAVPVVAAGGAAVPNRPNSAPEMVFSGAVGGRAGSLIDLSQSDDEGTPGDAPSGNPSPSNSGGTITGLCIVNNSIRPVRPLVRVLEVYNSSKVGSGAGDIGENGVGLKQGCATLSDLSFVLVKNGPDKFVELGIVAESLQMAEGCYLPAFRFTITDGDDDIEHLKDQMTLLFSKPEHRNVARCIERYGSVVDDGASDMEKGIDRLLNHFESVLDFYNNRYVFAVILDGISYGNSKGQRRSGSLSLSGTSLSNDPIKDLRDAIPRTYLHIPHGFDFRIGDNHTCGREKEKVVFHYWPQRLVELSSFTVMVNEKLPWYDPRAHVGSYKLRVFIGFDRYRILEEGKAGSLYIYSRESGRLIKHEPDARHSLGLNASGSTYCSGLTVLVDDVEGKLPLNPTKQDVAFGEQEHGEVHRDNLFAWVGAVSKFFYDYHLTKFDNKKTILTAKIKEFGAEPVIGRPLKEIDRSTLTNFDAQFRHYGKRSIRIEQKSAEQNVGPDTHFILVGDEPGPATGKRKRNSPVPPAHPPARPPPYSIPTAQQQQHHIKPEHHAPRRYHPLPYPGQPNYANGYNQHAQQTMVPHQQSALGYHTQAHNPKINKHHHLQAQQLQVRQQQIQQQLRQAQQQRQQQQQHPGQHPGHVGSGMPSTVQGITPPSLVTSNVARASMHQTNAPSTSTSKAQPTREERVARAGEDQRARINAARATAAATDAAEVSESSAKNGKEGADDASIVVIDDVPDDNREEKKQEEDDDDESSVESTKDYYKNFCERLTLKMEKKKDIEHENRRLKEEISKLKAEIRRLTSPSQQI